EADGGLLAVRAFPSHGCWFALPGHCCPDSAARDLSGERRPGLPVGRYVDPDRGRRRPEHGAADRVAAPTATLRRVPALMQLLIMGPPGAGKGTQAKRIAERLGVPAISTGEIFRQNIADRTALGQEAQRYADRGEYVPD